MIFHIAFFLKKNTLYGIKEENKIKYDTFNFNYSFQPVRNLENNWTQNYPIFNVS